jgi:FkbM family methyltransferase
MLINKFFKSLLNVRHQFREECAHFTATSAVLLAFYREYNRIAKRHGLRSLRVTLHLRLRRSDTKLYLRTDSSDYQVFRQIFVEKEYAPLDDAQMVTTIVDCGANVGYSSLYFLNRFPQARVIAIEPDPSNAKLCEQNLKHFGNRATIIRGAIWPHKARLAVIRGEYGDGEAWATQVRPVTALSESVLAVEGVEMADILRMIDGSAIDILKIDIERSEVALFGSHTEPWLEQVRNIAIELHDEECRQAFHNALNGYSFRLQSSGELTIAKNLRRTCGPATS